MDATFTALRRSFFFSAKPNTLLGKTICRNKIIFKNRASFGGRCLEIYKNTQTYDFIKMVNLLAMLLKELCVSFV